MQSPPGTKSKDSSSPIEKRRRSPPGCQRVHDDRCHSRRDSPPPEERDDLFPGAARILFFQHGAPQICMVDLWLVVYAA